MKNALNWFEIPSKNFKRAVKFYNTLLNAQLRLEDAGGTPNAIFPYSDPGMGGAVVKNDVQPSTSGPIVYLNVEGDLEGALTRTEPAGGKVLLPKTHIGEPGYIAIILDTEGNRLGLHSPN
jgi:hypothetical protein